MNPHEQVESAPERIPSKEEVLEVLTVLAKGEKFVPVREKFDDKGLYLLEVIIKDKITVESTHYEYRRKGSYPEGSTDGTVINVEFYEGSWSVGGHNAADLDAKTGMWIYTT